MFLDDAAVTSSTADYTIPVTTSYVILNRATAQSATLPDGTIPGQLMTILSINAGEKTIAVTTPLSTNANNISMASEGMAVLLMWTGSAWATLTAEGVTSAQ